MNDALKMQISAYVDDELPANEAEFLTRRLSQDPELRRQAGEYLGLGRLIRGERRIDGAAKLRARIAAAVEAETTVVDINIAPGSRSWARPGAGVAIAASVAMLALLGLRQFEFDGEQQNSSSAAAASLAAAPQASYTEPALNEVVPGRPSDMLMQYYLSHGATSGELGANGILSRLVTLELRGEDLAEIAPVQGEPEAAPADVENEEQPALTEE